MLKAKKEPIDSTMKRGIQIPVFLFSACMTIFGFAVIIWLILSITQNPIINLALHGVQNDNSGTPSLIVAFLLEFGFVLPIITLGMGGVFIWLGLKLLTRDIQIARWVQSALMWMAILASASIAYQIFQIVSANLSNQPQPDASPNAESTFIFFLFLIIIVFVAGGLWLERNIKLYFIGKERLNSREVRFAWNLLIPTLAIFLLVAARPLEQTFIRSITDKRFAGQEVPNFVGLDNYRRLLGVRLDTVTCKFEKSSDNCATTPNGSILWESIKPEYLSEGYRTVWRISLPFSNRSTALAISGLDKDFLQAIGTTLLFTIISVSLELSVALFMAMTVNSNFIGRGLMRAVMLVPWAIPTVISAKLWDLMLKDTSAGIINRVLMDLHFFDLPQAWLSVPALQIPSAIMVDVWKTSPFMALLLLAGLQTIPSDLYEASAVDGATPIQQFFSITLPLLRPTIAVALVFRTLDALRVFDLFNVLFGRQQLSMATYNYEMLVNSQKDGYASAVSIIIFILISVFAIAYIRMLRMETE